eukprot:7388171-Prymnesium_polylepis.2
MATSPRPRTANGLPELGGLKASSLTARRAARGGFTRDAGRDDREREQGRSRERCCRTGRINLHGNGHHHVGLEDPEDVVHEEPSEEDDGRAERAQRHDGDREHCQRPGNQILLDEAPRRGVRQRASAGAQGRWRLRVVQLRRRPRVSHLRRRPCRAAGDGGDGLNKNVSNRGDGEPANAQPVHGRRVEVEILDERVEAEQEPRGRQRCEDRLRHRELLHVGLADGLCRGGEVDGERPKGAEEGQVRQRAVVQRQRLQWKDER